MNRTVILFFLLFISIVAPAQDLVDQKPGSKSWNTNDPFKTNVFIGNQGQFNNWSPASSKVKYAINNNDKIFFTATGIVYRLEKYTRLSEEEREEREQENEKEAVAPEIYFVSMQWEGCNANPLIQVMDEAEGYYTFGEKDFENIKAKGYKKLLYKGLYPGIDVEYYIPDEGGIKYKLIAQAGADLSLIKMKYSGDLDDISADHDGNIVIRTPAGNIIDHAPKSYYEGNATDLPSSFEISGNSVSYRLTLTDNILANIIIDPWTTTPNSLTADHVAYDIDFDDNGNVYVAGGTIPFKIAKYTSTGAFIWTYTSPSGWGSDVSYSKFCILPNSGSIFMGEGINLSSFPRIMKIRTNGTLQFTSAPLAQNDEIATMFYNRCTKQLIGFGGGTSNTNNLQIISDTNLTSNVNISFNGYAGSCCNDITCAIMDYNGDFFALASSAYNATPGVNNQLQKSLVAANYLPPCAFDVPTGYDFQEVFNYGIPGFMNPPVLSVRSNSLALNNNYLFSYDGKTLKAWNKTVGNLLGSVVVNAAYAGGQNRTHEGIDADECNFIYVGGTNQVHIFTFTGSAFAWVPSIVTNIPAEVLGVKLNRTNGMLYVCGQGFVTVTDQTVNCPSGQIPVTATIDSCQGNACVTATGGTPPYNYQWSTGDTTNCITGVPPGIYVVTVTDHSCVLLQHIDTIVIYQSMPITLSNDTTICLGDSVTLSVNGATSYTWAPAAGLNTTTGDTIIAKPLITTTYHVTATASGCTTIDSVNVTVISAQSVTVMPNPASICPGDSVPLTANGASTYLWSPATGLTADTGNSVIAYPSSTSTYFVTGTMSGCTDSTSVTVFIIPPPNVTVTPNPASLCIGDSVTLTANNASSYEWSPANGLSDTSGSVVIAKPASTATYIVTGTLNGCTNTVSVTVNVLLQPIVTLFPDSATICPGDSVVMTANGAASYTWSPITGIYVLSGGNAVAYPRVTTSYTVTGSNGGAQCTATDNIIISVYPNPVVTISSDPATVCPGDLIEIMATEGFISYLWNTGEGLCSIISDHGGLFWVQVRDASNCPASDSIIIEEECESTLFIPNAFTPNGDGYNDLFAILGDKILSFNIWIYNRWGELVFNSNDINLSWDGKYMGKRVPDGVYVWYLEYEAYYAKTVSYKHGIRGIVTVIK